MPQHISTVESTIETETITKDMRNPLLKLSNRTIKRTFDLSVGLLACIISLPFLPIIALIIKSQSCGPILFKQERTGLGGKTFVCYKFRTMRLNDESDTLQATANDPRIFAFGSFMRRTHIDEIPNFINVLKGDMSIIGPRLGVELLRQALDSSLVATLVFKLEVIAMAAVLVGLLDYLATGDGLGQHDTFLIVLQTGEDFIGIAVEQSYKSHPLLAVVLEAHHVAHEFLGAGLGDSRTLAGRCHGFCLMTLLLLLVLLAYRHHHTRTAAVAINGTTLASGAPGFDQ